MIQRKRDDNKNKICAFQGGVGRGAGRKIVQNAIFRGKRHDNKILKVKISLSRKFVVMAQVPIDCERPQLVRALANIRSLHLGLLLLPGNSQLQRLHISLRKSGTSWLGILQRKSTIRRYVA